MQAEARSAARLAAPVLCYLANHPGATLTPGEIGRIIGEDARMGEQLAAWLERVGLFERTAQRDGEQSYALAAGERRRARGLPLILLVEDRAQLAQHTETLLASEGYAVIIARNPLEAHALLRVTAFDLILTDSFAPTLELSMRVLAPLLRRAACTPVVLFTAHHWDAARVQAEGFADIIPQPLAVEPFLARIERLLERRRQEERH